jgi:hypothetical protein
MPELIEPGRTGALFEPGDVDDFVRQAEDLLSQQERDPAGMRQTARQSFKARFTADTNYPMLMKCYDRALSRLPRRAI